MRAASAIGSDREGDDLLTGGLGADEFRFFASDGAGHDTVSDFQTGEDSFRLYSLTIDSVTDAGVENTLITFSSGATVTLLGVTGIDEQDLF